MTQPLRINFLYTNIGRGHPSYLDGIVESMIRQGETGLVRTVNDVFDVSHGLSRLAWKTVRYMYRRGSSRGFIGRVYERIRSGADYNNSGVGLRILGRDIRKYYTDDNSPLILAHPMLVGILAGRKDIVYQHGELVVPHEALVAGASKVFVPTSKTARAFIKSGYNPDDVIVTGLCVEPALVRQAQEALMGGSKGYLQSNRWLGLFSVQVLNLVIMFVVWWRRFFPQSNAGKTLLYLWRIMVLWIRCVPKESVQHLCTIK